MAKTTKVKMLTSVAGGPDSVHDLGEHSFSPGQIVELHTKKAAAWIASGLAEAVDEDNAVEAAVLPEVETAMESAAPNTKGRRKKS